MWNSLSGHWRPAHCPLVHPLWVSKQLQEEKDRRVGGGWMHDQEKQNINNNYSTTKSNYIQISMQMQVLYDAQHNGTQAAHYIQQIYKYSLCSGYNFY